jgi:D-serine deaminase-like pyridoxal phosphate-dependent protein
MLFQDLVSERRFETPALLLDAGRVRRNLQRLADYAVTVGIRIRPHTKTHKSREIARRQLELGAIGLTAAKVSEAENLSSSDDDVLVAYPPLGAARAKRLATLARDRTVRAALDSIASIEAASAAAQAAGVTIGLLIDLDVGVHRTGVQSPEQSLALAQAVDRAAGVRLDGIMIYPGHIWATPNQQTAPLQAVNEILDQTIHLWERSGLAASVVSGGSTPTAYQSHLIPRLTEIRPGTYVFNDINTVRGGFCTLDDCAARVIATIVSDAVPGHVVLDSGSKVLTSDLCVPLPSSGHGHVVEYPDAKITRLSEEHAQVDVSACERRPRVGECVTVVPNHICPCINLQDSVWWIEPNEPPRPFKIDARGKSQ